jgi:phosphomannomutase
LIAERELKKQPGASIIYNLISSKAVKEVITENGGKPLRSRVGHSYIKAMMGESGAIFGGEHSGHFYFAQFWRADSGMLAALHAIAALGTSDKTLSELLKPYARYISSGEINSKVQDPVQKVSQIKAIYADTYQSDELDGLTITSDTWWFNVRASNTEPLLRLNVEADSPAKMAEIRDELLKVIRS